LGALVFASWGVAQVVSGETSRAHGPLIDPNGYAAALNLFWFALAARFLSLGRKDLPRWMMAGMIIVLTLIAMAFFAAASRGATLSWLICLPVLMWLVRHAPEVKHRGAILAATVFVGLVLIQTLSANMFIQHAGQGFQHADPSAEARLLIWKATLTLIREHPLLGTGLGTWSHYYPSVRPDAEWSTTGFYAHNDYLQLAAEGGVLMPILFITGLAIMAGTLWKLGKTEHNQAARMEAGGLLIAVMAVSLHAFVNFIFYFAFINILVGVFAGRAWQICNGAVHFQTGSTNALHKKLGALVLILAITLAALHLLLNQAAELLYGRHPFLAYIQRTCPAITKVRLAALINDLSPNEPIAQNILLDDLTKRIDGVSEAGLSAQQDALKHALAAYDRFIPGSLDQNRLLADEAMLLIRHRSLLPAGEAISRARQLAEKSLQGNPRHVPSIIALAQSEFASGRKTAGLHVIASAIPHLFRIRDLRLLQVFYVKELLSPGKDPELEEMARKLEGMPPFAIGYRNDRDLAYFRQVHERLESISRKYALNTSGALSR
jgi:hypothetical protein